MTLMFPTIFLNSPAIFFAVVNILRIWEDFKCLCLSGLFLQKHSRTVFWQQEAYKNLEKKKIKKNKAFETERLRKERTCATISEICKAITSYIKEGHLSTENQTSVCTEWMLPWPPVWLPRRSAWERFRYPWLSRHSWTLPCVVGWNWFICSKLLVALFCLLKFNNKGNRGSL